MTATCKTCQAEIEKATFLAGAGPFRQVVQRKYCEDCIFLEGFRQTGLCPRPYRVPARRPTKDGQAPLDRLLQSSEWKAACPEPNAVPGGEA